MDFASPRTFQFSFSLQRIVFVVITSMCWKHEHAAYLKGLQLLLCWIFRSSAYEVDISTPQINQIRY